MVEAINGITEDAVRKALSTVQEPELHRDLITLNMVRDITISGNNVGFTIVLTTPACPLRSQMEHESIAAVKQLVPGVEEVQVRFDAQVRADSRIAGKLNIPVKNIIAVASAARAAWARARSHQPGGQPGDGRRKGGRAGCRHLWAEYPHDVRLGRATDASKTRRWSRWTPMACRSSAWAFSCPKARRWSGAGRCCTRRSSSSSPMCAGASWTI